MKCSNIKEYLTDYLDGVLTPELQLEVEKHLGNCESCLDEVNQLKNLFGDISEVEFEKPDESLRDNFYTMLAREKLRVQKHKKSIKYYKSKPARRLWMNSPLMQIAAGFAILVIGTFLGLKLSSMILSNGTPDSEMAILRNEMNEMKQLVMFSMLEQESASKRIKAVSYIEEVIEPDPKVVQALVNTLNNDNNANVRLVAVNALFRFADNQVVRDSLIEALGTQTDPLIQITLINMMVELEEKRSIGYLRKIADDTQILETVRYNAQKGLTVLL